MAKPPVLYLIRVLFFLIDKRKILLKIEFKVLLFVITQF